MDLTPVMAAAVGGAIALAAQAATARTAMQTSQRQIDYERWESWRREAAIIWADLLAVVREMNVDFSSLVSRSDDELDALRARSITVVRGLDHLAVLALDRRVGDWSRQLAGMLATLARLLPSHHGCDDPDRAKRYEDHRRFLEAQVEWNDGDRSSQLTRFREALRESADPPMRRDRRRQGRRRQRFTLSKPSSPAVQGISLSTAKSSRRSRPVPPTTAVPAGRVDGFALIGSQTSGHRIRHPGATSRPITAR